MSKNRVVVVGSGLGGLTAAAYLSKYGFDVDVFERNSYPGGYACSFVRGEYEFEATLHAMSGVGPAGNRGNCYRLLEECGVAKRVEFLPIPELMTVVFPDMTAEIPVGWDGVTEAYCRLFPHQQDGIKKCLDFQHKLYEETRWAVAGLTMPQLLQAPYKVQHLIRATGLTAEQGIMRYVDDVRFKTLMTNMWGFYSLPPNRLTHQLFSLANACYITHGGVQIKGTSQALANAFVEAIEEHRGRVHFRNGVTRINTTGGRVTGVMTESGDEVEADYVVCNANPYTTCYDLIGADKVPARHLKALADGRVSTSMYNVYLVLDCPAEELGMNVHELFVNDSYDQDEHFRAMQVIDKPKYWMLTNYNHTNPEFSPPGTCVLVISAIQDGRPWTRVAPDRYADVKSRFAEMLVDEAERILPGLKKHITYMEGSTPITNMRYTGSPFGAILGQAFSTTRSPFLKLTNNGPFERLYYANAWARIGGGYETTITGGSFAFAEVWKDYHNVKGLKKLLPFPEPKLP
ncbi:MAG: phytoene desaturase family protein [Candidatus Geothermincolia bacterium]